MFKSVATTFVAASDADPAFGHGFHQQQQTSPSSHSYSHDNSFGCLHHQHHYHYHHQQQHVHPHKTSIPKPPRKQGMELPLVVFEEPSIVGLSCDSSLSSSSSNKVKESRQQDDMSRYNTQSLRQSSNDDDRDSRTMVLSETNCYYNTQSTNFAMTLNNQTSDPTFAAEREHWAIRREHAKATAIHPNRMHMKQQRKAKMTGGTIGGAIVGGLVLGPVGAVLGGAVGGAGARRLAKVGEKRAQSRFEQRNFQKAALESSAAWSAGIV